MKLYGILRRKLDMRGGFTLTEMLLTTLILLMVASVVAVGVPSAANAYSKVVDAANAQDLLSTTVTNLRSELAFANRVELGSDSMLSSYNNGKLGGDRVLTNGTDGIKVGPATTNDGPKSIDETLLVTSVAATKGIGFIL